MKEKNLFKVELVKKNYLKIVKRMKTQNLKQCI